MIQRKLGVAHASVVQDDHVRLGAAPALAMVRRRLDLGDHAGIGMELGHKEDHTQDTDALKERKASAGRRRDIDVNDCGYLAVNKLRRHRHGRM